MFVLVWDKTGQEPTLEWNIFTQVGGGLTRKEKKRPEKLARDKHYRLLQKFIYYWRKKFYNIVPGIVLLI